MCGRYTLTEVKELEKRFGLSAKIKAKVGENYNVGPGQSMPIVVRDEDGNTEVKLARWGFPWKNKDGKQQLSINARADSLTISPMWRGRFNKTRCIVPASGFYEWKKKTNEKEPHYFHLKDRELFGFAGLFSVTKTADDYETFTYVIITTTPNKQVGALHNRMPVILDKVQERGWLNPDSKIDDLLNMLDPFDDSKMITHVVSKDANSTRNNYPELIYPL